MLKSMKKIAIIRYIYVRILWTLTLISPRLNVVLLYYKNTGNRLNLDNPKTMDEKISWLKLYKYADNNLVKICADKYLVRGYLESIGEEKYLNQLYGVFNNYDEIDWEQLPDQFALKWSSGSGMNFICKDKSKIDHKELKRTLTAWKKSKPYLTSAELHYKVKNPRIICEKYLGSSENELPTDYKIYCFNGEPKAIRVMANRDTELSGLFMSLNWELISGITRYKQLDYLPHEPVTLQEMVSLSKKLSKPFPFVRIDFYEVENTLVFGDMTFTPSSGTNVIVTSIEGVEMSDMLDIYQPIEEFNHNFQI